jgi:putative DNA primase/helicase
MSMLRAYARALGGVISGHQVCFPGPGHSPKDRSCTLRLSPAAPDGFIVFSHAGEDFRILRDHVRVCIGITPSAPASRPVQQPSRGEATAADVDQDKIRRAQKLWSEGVYAGGTLVQRYLASRRLELPVDVAGDALRFHPACPWREDGGMLLLGPAMLAACRDIHTDEIVGVHRTRLNERAEKVGRKMLGLVAGAAIKLDCDANVTTGLTIGEGIETVLTRRQLGLRPAWALGSVGAIAKFPVLSGIECLTVLAEAGVPSQRAVEECASRWHAAGREVLIVDPRAGSDINDAWREVA